MKIRGRYVLGQVHRERELCPPSGLQRRPAARDSVALDRDTAPMLIVPFLLAEVGEMCLYDDPGLVEIRRRLPRGTGILPESCSSDQRLPEIFPGECEVSAFEPPDVGLYVIGLLRLGSLRSSTLR